MALTRQDLSQLLSNLKAWAVANPDLAAAAGLPVAGFGIGAALGPKGQKLKTGAQSAGIASLGSAALVGRHLWKNRGKQDQNASDAKSAPKPIQEQDTAAEVGKHNSTYMGKSDDRVQSIIDAVRPMIEAEMAHQTGTQEVAGQQEVKRDG